MNCVDIDNNFCFYARAHTYKKSCKFAHIQYAHHCQLKDIHMHTSISCIPPHLFRFIHAFVVKDTKTVSTKQRCINRRLDPRTHARTQSHTHTHTHTHTSPAHAQIHHIFTKHTDKATHRHVGTDTPQLHVCAHMYACA